MIRKIEYQNKVAIDDIAVPEKNKITDSNMNEIKAVVNQNAEELKNTNTMVVDFVDDAEDRIEAVENATSEATSDISALELAVENLEQNTYTKTETNGLIGDETAARQSADTNLQNQIDAIAASSDVVDVVGTYQDLQNYDTSHLSDKDIVKVLQDSTHNNAVSYYRWHNNTWNYVGSEGPFYTKGEADEKFVEKVEGKGLSTNDFTDADVSKLDSIETGADVNKIETIKVNGSTQTIENKSVNIPVPTNTSDLNNNSGFITKGVDDLTNYYTKTELNTTIEKANTALQTTDIVSSVDSSSTNTKAVGAKLFYDTLGNLETILTTLDIGGGV